MKKTFSIRLPASSSDNLKSKIDKRVRNLKWVVAVAFVIAFALCGAVRRRRSRQEKSSASVSWIIALLLVARCSWRRSGKSCASLDGLRERISPSSTDLPSKSLSAYLSLRRTWFVLRLI